MAFYSVHLPGSGPEAAAKAAFVRQSFSWKAFFFGPFWLAWHRLWIALLVWVVLYILLVIADLWLLTSNTAFLIGVALQILLGLEAASLREAKLAAKGYRVAEVIAAPARDEAEIAFFRQFGGAIDALPKSEPDVQGTTRP